jgi:dipeptidyl aminopeptidase/acylaminoacyl peptidase
MSAGEVEVSFASGGERVFGTLRQPVGRGRRPAAIFVHGFGSFRDELTGFVGVAHKLAAVGIASLRLDMRGCGKSGARGFMHPMWDWIADIRNGVSLLETLPGIAGDRIGIVGMSMGGGTACIAAALDNRLKVVVALAPVTDGEGWFRHLWTTSLGERRWRGFLAEIAEDRRRRALKGRSRVVNVLDAMAYQADDRRAFLAMAKAYPAFLKRIALSAVDSAMLVRAAPFAPLIAPRPLLIIHSRADGSVPVAQAEALAAAAQPSSSRLLLIDDSPHCFWIADQSERVQQESVDWLRERL